MNKVKKNYLELTEEGNAIFDNAVERLEKAHANWVRWATALERERKELEDAKNKTP